MKKLLIVILTLLSCTQLYSQRLKWIPGTNPGDSVMVPSGILVNPAGIRYALVTQITGGGGGPETDPIYAASAAAGISSGNISNWNTAYGWGNHASAGYFSLPSFTSGSVLFSNGSTITQDNSSLFWDNTNKRLGVGTSTPGNVFEVYKNQAYSGSLSSMTQIIVNNPNATGFSAFAIWGNGAERGRMQYNCASPNIFFTTVGSVPFYIGTNNTVRITAHAGGNITLGTINDNTAGLLQVNGSIVPSVNNNGAIGAPAYKFSAAYFTGVASAGSFEPGSSTDAAAANNRIYYSTTQGKLVYKDASGTVNSLY